MPKQKYCYNYSDKPGHLYRCDRDSKGNCTLNNCVYIPFDKLPKDLAREARRFENAIKKYG